MSKFGITVFTQDSIKEYYTTCGLIQDAYKKALYEAEKTYEQVQKDLYQGMLKAQDQAKLSLVLKEHVGEQPST